MDYQALLNKSIKTLRLNNNLTQEEFAEKAGISPQGLSNIERNRYQPTAQTIDKICSAFKITPIELLTPKEGANHEIVENIAVLLSGCPKAKLKKIYQIVCLLVRL